MCSSSLMSIRGMVVEDSWVMFHVWISKLLRDVDRKDMNVAIWVLAGWPWVFVTSDQFVYVCFHMMKSWRLTSSSSVSGTWILGMLFGGTWSLLIIWAIISANSAGDIVTCSGEAVAPCCCCCCSCCCCHCSSSMMPASSCCCLCLVVGGAGVLGLVGGVCCIWHT